MWSPEPERERKDEGGEGGQGGPTSVTRKQMNQLIEPRNHITDLWRERKKTGRIVFPLWLTALFTFSHYFY